LTTTSGKPVAPYAHIRRVIASSARFLHLYLSMVSFAVVLFFAVTGLTLNHQDWFSSQQKTSVLHGVAPHQMLGNPAGIDKLGLVEMLRARGIQGAESDLRVDDTQVEISFKGPGYSADAFIDRESGKYDLTETRNGFFAIINDLHKGRDSGKAWSVLIDISAILLILVSVTGLVLIWFMHKRRTNGFLLLLSGLDVRSLHTLGPLGRFVGHFLAFLK
jgi:hypothetical protein